MNNNSNMNDRKIDMSFYKPNTLGYYGVLLSVLFQVAYTLTTLNAMDKTYLIGVFILINIGVLLLLFTCALQVKVYNRKATITILVFAVYALSRMITGSLFLGASANMLTIIITSIGMFVGLGLSGLDGLSKVMKQRKYIKDGKISFVQMSK